MTAINTTSMVQMVQFHNTVCNCCGVKSTVFRVDVDQNGDGGRYTEKSCNCSPWYECQYKGLGCITMHHNHEGKITVDFSITDGDRLNVYYKDIDLWFDENNSLCSFDCRNKLDISEFPELSQYLRILGYFV